MACLWLASWVVVVPACFLQICVKNCFIWSNFYYVLSSGEKSCVVHSSHKEEKPIPTSYPSNNLIPQCSLGLSSLFSTFVWTPCSEIATHVCLTGVTMKRCPFRTAKLLEPSIKKSRTVIEWLTAFNADRLVHVEFSQFWSFPRWTTYLVSCSLLSSEHQLPGGTSCFCFCLQG